jgi:hypothetical protein
MPSPLDDLKKIIRDWNKGDLDAWEVPVELREVVAAFDALSSRITLRLYDVDEGDETIGYVVIPLELLPMLENEMKDREIGFENLGPDIPQLNTVEEIKAWAKGKLR